MILTACSTAACPSVGGACRSSVSSMQLCAASDLGALPSTPATSGLGPVLDRLARLDASAAALRVLLYLISKAETTGRTSWALPVESIGSALGLHRNSIGRALLELQRLGCVRRKAVLSRGAPTRTTLTLDGLPSVGVIVAVRASLDASRPPAQEPVEHIDPVPADQPRLDCAAPSRPDFVSSTTAIASPASVSMEKGRAPAESVPRAEIVAMQAFLFSLKGAAVAALERATLEVDPAALVIDPAWGFTDQEAAWFRGAVPKREAPSERPRNCVPRTQASGEVAPAEVAQVLLPALPLLASVAGGEGGAAELADEIAFMVVRGGLGRGDLAGGARAGLSLVRRGVWRRPALMHEAWRGAVLRGAQAPGASSQCSTH